MQKTILYCPIEVVKTAEKTTPHEFRKEFLIHEPILQRSLALLLLEGIQIKPKLLLRQSDRRFVMNQEWLN